MTINPAPLAKLAEVSQPPRPEVEVDDFDLALLRALAADARQSQRALARQIEMSPPAVADRLARLERSGVIRGYRAEIDWAALGLPVVVYLAVTAAAGMDLSEIIREIQELPEAETMSVVTGSTPICASCCSARSSRSPACSAPRRSCRSPTSTPITSPPRCLRT
jgi:Lrp/AsnC family leucine-responsive transcriptional regulator